LISGDSVHPAETCIIFLDVLLDKELETSLFIGQTLMEASASLK